MKISKLSLITAVILPVALVGVLSSGSSADDLSTLRSRLKQATIGFTDMKATVEVTESNRRELEKMGASFAQTYQFKKADVTFKSPFKFKMSGELGMVKAEYIMTENARLVRIPSIRYKKRKDITKLPDERMISLEVGVVADSIWETYKTVKIERIEKNSTGGTAYVVRLQTAGSKKWQLIWVDSQTLKLLRRDRYNDDGALRSRVMYLDHKQIGGIWVPSRAEVYNKEGKLAAVTETRDTRVNAGIGDKEFE